MNDETKCDASMFQGIELFRATAVEMLAPIEALLGLMYDVIGRGRIAASQGKQDEALKRFGEAEGLWIGIRELARRMIRDGREP